MRLFSAKEHRITVPIGQRYRNIDTQPSIEMVRSANRVIAAVVHRIRNNIDEVNLVKENVVVS